MKHMKKIAFLVSGNIRIYEKNLIFLHNLKKKFSNYKIIFISSIWENQNDKDNFKDKYEIEFINEIKQKNWSENIDQIKFVTGDENRSWKINNIFHMWHAIVENINFLEFVVDKNNLEIDYVCRFRTDIMSLDENINIKDDLVDLKDDEFLFSSNRHFRGLTDLFFIANYKTFLKLKDIINYLNKFCNDDRVFDPEYIFYCFISENNFLIKIAHKFNLALIRMEEAKPTKKVFIPLKDKINMKLGKRKIKFIKLINRIKYFWK